MAMPHILTDSVPVRVRPIIGLIAFKERGLRLGILQGLHLDRLIVMAIGHG